MTDILRSGWDDDSGEPCPSEADSYIRAREQWFRTSLAERWQEFCEKLKADPDAELELPPLFDEDIYRVECCLNSGMAFHRARLSYDYDDNGRPVPYSGLNMSAPPANKATAGRANVENEVVLYCADQEETAIAEVRPSRGLWISVARGEAVKVSTLADLTHIPPAPNPFTDELAPFWVEFGSLLRAFGFELSRPLRRTDNTADYLPSQRLTRRLKQAGFDGIRYPSSLAPHGTNVVFFEPAIVTFTDSRLVAVDNMQVKYHDVQSEVVSKGV